jgi:hypothetical protein
LYGAKVKVKRLEVQKVNLLKVFSSPSAKFPMPLSEKIYPPRASPTPTSRRRRRVVDLEI